jgi:pimeloyl-ACP methyl ester carboxylesterase
MTARQLRQMGANERIVQANEVDICVETFGDPRDRAILLISGAAASMDWWEDEFCQRLAAGFRFVIRYDHRDTGRSVNYEPGAPKYSGEDLLADAVGVLDALGLARAHLVGVSIGGAIAQLMALDHPERVASLTLISTSPGPDPDLPPMSEELRALFAEEPAEPDWSDPEAVIDYIVEGERPFAARSRPFDEGAKRALARRIVDRTVNIAFGHEEPLAPRGRRSLEGATVTPRRLCFMARKTRCFHTATHSRWPTRSPVPRLVPLEGTGHEVPPREVWVIVAPAILQHTSGAAPADAAVSVTGYRVESSVPGPLPPSGSPR